MSDFLKNLERLKFRNLTFSEQYTGDFLKDINTVFDNILKEVDSFNPCEEPSDEIVNNFSDLAILFLDEYGSKKNIERIVVLEIINELHTRKNHDYGDSFSETYDKLKKFNINPLISCIVPIQHKINRISNLYGIESKSKVYEPILDTIIDGASYCIMTLTKIIK